MMRILLMRLLLLVFLFLPLQVMADTTSQQSAHIAPVLYSAIPGRPSVAEGSLLERVRGRYCRGCRLDCVADRNDCYYYETARSCRLQFSRCMKRCWRRYCR